MISNNLEDFVTQDVTFRVGRRSNKMRGRPGGYLGAREDILVCVCVQGRKRNGGSKHTRQSESWSARGCLSVSTLFALADVGVLQGKVLLEDQCGVVWCSA